MLRPILLVSVLALTTPAWAQETTDAPPVTEGVAAPEAEDQAAPDLPPGEVPTGTDHGTMDHGGTQTDSTTTTTTATEATEESASGTMTTATEGETVGANAEASTEADVAATTGSTTTTTTTTATTTADVGTAVPAAPTATFTGMGGPADIQSEWATFDKGGDGMLTPLEFAVWMADSRGQPATEESVKGDAVELLNEAADELGLVDANNDWHVSREELTAASPQ